MNLPLLLAAMVVAGEPLPSDRLTLEQLEAALPHWPPRPANAAARARLAAAFDQLVTIQTNDALTDADRAALAPLIAFYRRRCDLGLEALASPLPADGVRLTKFYSSSVVVQSSAGTVAIDFCQGPINNGGEPEERDHRRTGFYLTPAQRDRLATLVDASLITHRHHDHADFSLSRLLLEAGKPVLGPAQLPSAWPSLAGRLLAPPGESVLRVGPAEVRCFAGHQYAQSEERDGQRFGVPNAERAAADSESLVLLVRLGGVTFLQAAENHDPAEAFLRAAAAEGWLPEVVFSTGQYQGARSVDAFLAEHPPALRLPLHEYELTHGGGGNRMAPWFRGDQVAAGAVVPLFWGESVLLRGAPPRVAG